MNTITLYLDGHTRTRRAKSLLVGGIVVIGTLAFARREPIVVEKVKVVTKTVIQIERVPASCEQYGPPAPPPPTPPPTPVRVRRARPRHAPTVSPMRLSFLAPGWEPVAIMNPYNVPIRVRNIAIRGDAARDFEIIGAQQCIGTLRAGERCRFSVFGQPAGKHAAIQIEIHHDASSKPLVIQAETGG
jgi:hypothetical protein